MSPVRFFYKRVGVSPVRPQHLASETPTPHQRDTNTIQYNTVQYIFFLIKRNKKVVLAKSSHTFL